MHFSRAWFDVVFAAAEWEPRTAAVMVGLHVIVAAVQSLTFAEKLAAVIAEPEATATAEAATATAEAATA